MRVGMSFKNLPLTEMQQIIDGATKSLRHTHTAGFVQCDIRSPNLLKFGDKWQLIDFGHSSAIDGNSYTVTSTQRSLAGSRIDGIITANTNSDCADNTISGGWLACDDYEMLIRLIYYLLKNRQNSLAPTTPMK
jgi:serine/threonine protein kinase